MSCEREEQTLLWAHGEAGDEHLAHLATCADCRATVAELEVVWAAVAARPAHVRVQGRSRRWPWAVGLVAAAASFAVASWPAPRPPPPSVATVDPVDDDLADVELAVDALAFDLSDQ